ncbi:MAG: enoyl-CoA hydratase-related protein [Myxococcota bacterium]|nr:enoyl-CoA hydratase/isomerase family protein [Deltaproteobacteria bacterium]MDQ3335743.1 enoyl-CoA hydratase-related protein [Myxococcota bacterium]
MSYTHLLVDRTEAIVTITINRREKLNALSEAVLKELLELCTKLSARGDVRGMLLCGAGDRAFVAGADISRMREMSVDEGVAFGRLGQQAADSIEALPFPVIACVQGFALGGGCELAMAADYIYATEAAVFGQPEVNLGLVPGFGGLVRLIRLVGPGRAKELIYTGRNVDASEALRIGLVNAVFSTRKEMMAAATASLLLAAARSPVAVAACKDVLRSLDGKSTAAQLSLENAAFGRVFASEDKREGVTAFVEKRRPTFAGR